MRSAINAELFLHLLGHSAAQYCISFTEELSPQLLQNYFLNLSALGWFQGLNTPRSALIAELFPHYWQTFSASLGFPRPNTPLSAFISAMLLISECGFPRPNTPHFLCIICGNRSVEKLLISALFAEIWAKVCHLECFVTLKRLTISDVASFHRTHS